VQTRLLLYAWLAVAAPAVAAERPNFLVILTDDQGYGDVSAYGASDVRTPHIDAIGRDGMVFTAMRANSTVCSPTRAALLTGCYPDRVGVPGVIRTQPENSWGFFDPAAATLPSELEQAGYHTALIGKWHLGLESPNTPTERGFEFFHGFLGDMMDSYTGHRRHGRNYMRRNTEVIEPEGHATDLFADWAVDYLQERARTPATPFFLELAFNAPHFPIEPPREWLDRVRARAPDLPPRRATNVAFIEHLDAAIGRVLAALDATDLARDTVVVFTSDNGGSLPHGQSNAPWRDGKQSMYDGGLRVPFLFRWPGNVKAGSRCEHPGLVFDLFPTFLELAGVPPPEGIDAVSLLPLLDGGTLDGQRDLYFVRRDGGLEYGGKSYEAFIRGDWKLLQPNPFAPLELYNLRDDPQEQRNLAAVRRKEFEELAVALRRQIQRGGGVPWQPPAQAADLEAEFTTRVRPLLATHCAGCHETEEPEAGFDTRRFDDAGSVAAAWHDWQAAVTRINVGEMPPPDTEHALPTPAERQAIADWTARFRQAEARRLRDDPGPVVIRRLNAAEYDHTIRDLTGADIRPAREFPVDPANEAGFDNSAESLTLPPALVAKYLAAARTVATHMVLAADGIRFAPHPVVTDTDRDRYCVNRIVDFYRRQPTQIADYIFAVWKLRETAGSVDSVATDLGLSRRYLGTVRDALRDTHARHGPLATLRESWQAIPADASDEVARERCQQLAADVAKARAALASTVAPPTPTGGLNAGSQPLVLWRNRRLAELRRSCRLETSEQAAADEQAKEALCDADLERLRSGSEADRQAVIDDCRRFCAVFPDAFFVIERGRDYLQNAKAAKEGQGRLLSAGFHSMTGYFRDDRPLCELVLGTAEQAELDRLWRDLDMITQAPIRQYTSLLWFERAETSFMLDESFAFARPEDRGVTDEPMIRRLRDTFLARIQPRKPSPDVVQAIETYFDDMNRQIRGLEAAVVAAEPAHVASLTELSARAARRPGTARNREAVAASYNASRAAGADHRTALEDTLVTMLMSPEFLLRYDLRCRSAAAEPLTDHELANRLSYFLWCSMPDGRLFELASEGRLREPEVLTRETRRMLADSRAADMLREFLGHWLEFRQFTSHAGVDRTTFPVFDDALRQAMADEPIAYVQDLIRRNGSITELIDSDHVIVNRQLARHYGLDERAPQDDSWHCIDGTRAVDRGGLLSMAVFLTQNSPGQRTSPVKRGYWVVRRLLGERIAAPPADVPQLPASEAAPGTLTVRELLARHRADPACGACHNRFDAPGLLLEGFDPVGVRRTTDLGGRAVSADATLPDGTEASGVAGLREYVGGQRRGEFRRHFCASLAAFALGRSLLISDDLLIDEMLARLDRDGDRIQTAFETIATSPQFLTKRPPLRPTGDQSHDQR
jgi:arylsulfatase A-like enzyme